MASSRIPKPCPPTDSARCTPCRPCSAAAFQYGGGFEIGVSRASCSTSDGATRATRDLTESARSLCSGEIAMGMSSPPGKAESSLLTGRLGASLPVYDIGQFAPVPDPPTVIHRVVEVAPHGVDGVPGDVRAEHDVV